MLTGVLFGWLFLSALEELDGGVSPDAVLLGQLGLLCGVHLTQADLGALGLQQASGLGELWSQGLAVTTPWGICRSVRRTHTHVYIVALEQRSSPGGPRPLGGPQSHCRGGPLQISQFLKVFKKLKCLDLIPTYYWPIGKVFTKPIHRYSYS